MENIYPDTCILCCLYIGHIYQISCLIWKKHTGNFRCVFLLPIYEKQVLVRFLRVIFQYSPSNDIELVAAKCSVNRSGYWIMQYVWYFNQKVLYSHYIALCSLLKHFINYIVHARGTLRRGRGSFELWGNVCPLPDRELVAKISCQPKSVLSGSGWEG